MASRAYQKRRLAELQIEGRSHEDATRIAERVTRKACICHDLGGGVTKSMGIDNKATPAVCPGPGILSFKREATLEEMLDHIYGRGDLLATDRPSVFITELRLYIDHLAEEVAAQETGEAIRKNGQLARFRANLLQAIEYYRALARSAVKHERTRFLRDLADLEARLDSIELPEELRVTA